MLLTRRSALRLVLLALLLAPLAATQPDELRVVSYNIRHGRGMDGEVDLKRIVGVLEALRPDVVGLQEVDERVKRSGGEPQSERLGGLLGMHRAFGRFMEYQGGEYGMAILSRHPIVGTQAVPLPEGNEPRVALAVDIRLPDDSRLTIINVHFNWTRDDGFRYAQAETLTKYLDALKTPYILLGDFNDRPGSRTLALFTARAGKAVKPEDARFTFPSGEPDREIDFIFFAPRDAWRAREVRVVDERVASDHRPVFAVLERTR